MTWEIVLSVIGLIAVVAFGILVINYSVERKIDSVLTNTLSDREWSIAFNGDIKTSPKNEEEPHKYTESPIIEVDVDDIHLLRQMTLNAESQIIELRLMLEELVEENKDSD